MDKQKIFRVIAQKPVLGPECECAVLVSTGRALLRMSIAEARELSLEIQRAADDAELMLKD